MTINGKSFQYVYQLYKNEDDVLNYYFETPEALGNFDKRIIDSKDKYVGYQRYVLFSIDGEIDEDTWSAFCDEELNEYMTDYEIAGLYFHLLWELNTWYKESCGFTLRFRFETDKKRIWKTVDVGNDFILKDEVDYINDQIDLWASEVDGKSSMYVEIVPQWSNVVVRTKPYKEMLLSKSGIRKIGYSDFAYYIKLLVEMEENDFYYLSSDEFDLKEMGFEGKTFVNLVSSADVFCNYFVGDSEMPSSYYSFMYDLLRLDGTLNLIAFNSEQKGNNGQYDFVTILVDKNYIDKNQFNKDISLMKGKKVVVVYADESRLGEQINVLDSYIEYVPGEVCDSIIKNYLFS